MALQPTNQAPAGTLAPFAVDTREAARLSSLSVWTIRQYVNNGRLRSTRIGGRVVIPVTAIQELVERGSDFAPRRRRAVNEEVQ
jgi:excisionase family DNA binding protein